MSVRTMSFIDSFSDTNYYHMTTPGAFNGASAMTFGIVCAVRSDRGDGVIQRFWGNWEDAGDTGWCVQKSAADMLAPAGQIWDMEAGAAGDTISSTAPVTPGSALYRPVFLVGVIDLTGADSLTMYINGATAATNADITPAAGAGDICLGRGSANLPAASNVPAPDVKVNMMFLESRAMTGPEIGQIWHQLERFGHLPSNGVIAGSGNINYFWDTFDVRGSGTTSAPGATWTSRGTAATPLTLTGVGYSTLVIAEWPNSGFGF